MGTREDLLAAAKQCLAERGYARTTVRDIVSRSGSNLAAINYHFGARDALLNQAMVESTTEAVQRILDNLESSAEREPAARLRTFLAKLTTSFTEDRGVWAANIESLAQALHSGEVRAEISAKQREARAALARMLAPGDNPDDALGAILLTLLDGLLVQWLLDPTAAPGPETIAAGLDSLNAALDR